MTKIPKISNFSGSSKISNFHENRGPPFLNFPGILVDTIRKMQEYTRFPKYSSGRADFSRKNVDPNF